MQFMANTHTHADEPAILHKEIDARAGGQHHSLGGREGHIERERDTMESRHVQDCVGRFELPCGVVWRV